MRFRRSKEEESGFLSIAPLVDIIFLLLIFFVATTQSPTATGFEVSLPGAKEPDAARLDNAVVITMHRGGALLLMGTPVEVDELAAEPVSYTHLTLPTKRIV